MAKKAKVDQEACIGCGACCGICPNCFAFNAEGKAEFVKEADAADEASVDDAIASCPVGAISED